MSFFLEIHRLLERGERLALVTVTHHEGSSPRKSGSRMIVRSDGSIRGTVGGGAVEHRVIEQALEALRHDEARVYHVHLTRELGMCCGGAMEFYIEPLEQDPTLILFGAGHVAHALAPMASAAGFKVVVVDEREELLTEDRFPMAERVLEDPLSALGRLPIDAQTYLVVVTHLHRLDEDLIRALAPRAYRYLGMIGSRGKVARFLERLRARGVPDEALSRITMPIGLHLHAVTPAEIAVSILAELILVRRSGPDALPPTARMNWRPPPPRERPE